MAEADTSTLGAKACKHCGDIKPLNAFLSSHGRTKDGRVGKCRACVNAEYRARRAADPQAKIRTADNTRRYREALCSEALRERRKAERQREAGRTGRVYWGREGWWQEQKRLSAEIQAAKESERQKRKAERIAHRIALKPWTDPSLTAAEQFALRYKADPEFNLKQRIRAHMRRLSRPGKIDDLVRSALKRNGTSRKAQAALGYTMAELRRHLERQFTKGMGRPTFTTGAIHVDHIQPLAGFDLTDPLEMRAAWALTNLRPMWRCDNIKKAAKRTLLL